MDINACLDNARHVHFIGIGGVSMSALALMLAGMGYKVTGSDDNLGGRYIERLTRSGIDVKDGRFAGHMAGARMAVYTAAVKNGHPQLLEARRKGIPAFSRSELLSAITKRFKCPVGVAGTHGKTTTTSMISAILMQADLDPTVMVGGDLALIGGNYRLGKSGFLVFESDEYKDSFLRFYPKISVMLNIEADHPDYFADLSAVVDSFGKYALNTLEGGTIIYNLEDENCARAAEKYPGQKLGFGLSGGEIYPRGMKNNNGYYSFDAILPGLTVKDIRLRVPGLYNVQNALAACAAACLCGAGAGDMRRALSCFEGAARRFEYIGRCNGAVIVDDYAHHPSEISATLSAVLEQGYGRVICVFQPHTYTRTKELLWDFAKALALADKVVLADIYAAREKNVYDISSADLAALIPESVHCPGSLDALAKGLGCEIKDGDIVITMGAGDIDKVARALCKQKSAGCGKENKTQTL